MKKLIVIALAMLTTGAFAAPPSKETDRLGEIGSYWDERYPITLENYLEAEKRWAVGPQKDQRLELIRVSRKTASTISDLFKNYRKNGSEANKNEVLDNLKRFCAEADQFEDMQGMFASVDYVWSIQGIVWTARYIDEELSKAGLLKNCRDPNRYNQRLEADAP
jgi:hypothetical protein